VEDYRERAGVPMGLIASIYRSDYDSEMNVFYGKSKVTLVNVEGPFNPTEDAPGAKLIQGYRNTAIIVPADDEFEGVQMNGGTYASTSDSRFQRAVEMLSGVSHFAVAIHDRRESWEEHERFSR
jgi:hypothetical protein